MKRIAIQTNINCGSCVANVTSALNEAVGKDNWKVDTQNPKKILTVTTEDVSEQALIKAVENAGYKAESLS
ncbi:hypothetical protein BH11BAC3_BH11BAC3_07150 [soil metagenome]